MTFSASMHMVCCTHSALSAETEKEPRRELFGLVHDELLADVLVGYLNLMTEEECPRLRGLADWRVSHQPVRVLSVGPEQEFADALVGRAFAWFRFGENLNA
jgi:hypothetical protein